MPITLLTGANGFVGASVLDALLKKGHTVVATVRALSSSKPLMAAHPEWEESKVTFVVVPDFTAPGAFDAVFQDHEIDYVAHVAAPVLDNPANTDFVEHFEKPSIAGNQALLESAVKHGKSVKAIGVIGSINSISTGDPSDLQSRVLDETQWLPMGRDEAISMQNAYISYCVGKKVAEKTIWSFVDSRHPAFSVTNLVAPIIIGPPLQAVSSMSKLNWSINQIYTLFNGSSETIPPTTFPGFVDVRDLADLLIRSFTAPAAANQRFIVGQPMTYQKLADALKSGAPELGGRVAKDSDDSKTTLARLDTTKLQEAMPIRWRSMEETLGDTARALVELEKKTQTMVAGSN